MKHRSIAGSIAVAFAIIAFGGAAGEAAAAQVPINPQQHFTGLVNGKKSGVVVGTVCPGPAIKHRYGPVQKGQTMAVVAAAKGSGYTGPFSQVYAWLQPAPAGTQPVILTFKQYGAPQRIPGSVRVPCNGTGEAVFSSCPYRAPCAFGFIPDTLKVTFKNMAVTHGEKSAGGVTRP
jgi:hypothetical protein